MTYKADYSFTRVNGNTKILVYFDDDAHEWEVYYKREHYPFMYAFGLPSYESADNVYNIAVCDIDDYNDLFEEE